MKRKKGEKKNYLAARKWYLQTLLASSLEDLLAVKVKGKLEEENKKERR